MKKRNVKMIFVALCTLFSMSFMTNTNIKANAQYEIVFKAGLHGTIDNGKSVHYPVEAGVYFPNEPVVQAYEGYVFKGWNKELPEVGSVVEGKQTYVAQYDVLVSGVNYIVRYVNEDNVEIATPKASMAEEDSTIRERAKVIPGYTYKIAQQEYKVTKKDNTFTFEYTLTNPDEVIRYENEVINQVVPPVGNQDNNNNANNNPNPDNGNPDNPNEDTGDTPTENVPEEETPLAKGDKSDNGVYLLIGGFGIALLVILAGLYISKKKHNDAKEL